MKEKRQSIMMYELEEKREKEEVTINNGAYRRATISMIDCKFRDCVFSSLDSPCSLGDWKFLNEVSERILQLNHVQPDEEGK